MNFKHLSKPCIEDILGQTILLWHNIFISKYGCTNNIIIFKNILVYTLKVMLGGKVLYFVFSWVKVC